MRFIIKFIIVFALFTKYHSISVGFKINGKSDSFLIIGDLSRTASCVQITIILKQLTYLKDCYSVLQNNNTINLKIGKNLKSAKSLSLYEIDSYELLNYINSQIRISSGKNYPIQSYFTVYNTTSLIISKMEPSTSELQVSLGDSVMVDLTDYFDEYHETIKPFSVVFGPDRIYGA